MECVLPDIADHAPGSGERSIVLYEGRAIALYINPLSQSADSYFPHETLYTLCLKPY